MNTDDIMIGDKSLKEWETLQQEQSPRTEIPYAEAEKMGLLSPQETQTVQQQVANKLYDAADKLGVERPADEKQYADSKWDWNTTKDVATSTFVEASHFFAPKAHELQYESKTKAGENMKYSYRYLVGTASFFFGGGWIGGAVKGIGVASKIPAAVKLGSGIQKLLSSADIINRTQFGLKAARAGISAKAAIRGAKFINASIGGAGAEALANFTLYRPEDNEGHMADAFGAVDNSFISWVQSDDNDTDTQARFKSVVEGLILGIGVGNVLEFAAKPLLGGLLKNIKTAWWAKTPKEAAQALQEVALDEVKIDKFASKADMYNSVQAIKADADASGQEASQLILDKMNMTDVSEAQQMLKVLNNGDEIFLHEDGSWNIKVQKWDDAYKVSPEEYNKQLKAQDLSKADDMFNTDAIASGDTAISHQDEAVRHTWTNRGWIGENEELIQNVKGNAKPNTSIANKIAKNYKDKWQVDNNVKVEFVDGLTVKGKAVEGNTQTTNYLGKVKAADNQKKLQNSLDKKNLQIQKLESKLELLGTGAVDKDTKNKLKEEIRIAKNEAGEISKDMKPKEKLANITIQIDTNTKNPYSVLRSELEHARDIAKGEVPNQKQKHFSRYDGLNEGEAASGYVYKKSLGKAQKLEIANTVDTIKSKVKQYETDGYTYKENKADGFGEHNIELKNKEGNRLGYAEYSIKNGVLSIEEVMNTTKRVIDRKTRTKIEPKGGDILPTPDVAEKLVDKIIAENPCNTIQWDAISPKGIELKNKYLTKHPELKSKVEEVSSREELDPEGQAAYDSIWEGLPDEDRSRLTRTSDGNIQQSSGAYSTRADAVSLHRKPNDNTEGILEEPLVSGNTRNDERRVASSSNKKETYGQLESDFNSKIVNANDSEEIINGIVSGELKPKTTYDMEQAITKTIETDPEISGHTWKDLADDAEALFEKIEDSLGSDISAYKEAFIKNDTKALDIISRKELAIVKVSSMLADKLDALGLDAPIQAKRNIVDMIDYVAKYTADIRSGAGRLLNEQKLINRSLETFGSMRLSELTKEGIKEFADLLAKDVKELFNLQFSRGKQINPAQIKKEIFTRAVQYGDGAFLKLLSKDQEFALGFSGVLDNMIKTQGNIDVVDLYQQIEDVVVIKDYNNAIKSAKLAPKAEGKSNIIKNWVSSQGGLSSYYVHNLLSGLGSIAKNIGSGTLNGLYYPARKIVAGVLGGGSTMSKEGWNTYKNMIASWSESWKLGAQAFATGEGKLTNIGADTLNMEDGVFRGFHDISDTNMWHIVQNFHSFMTRTMGASDEFMSQLNYRSICRAKCLNQADKYAKLAGKEADEVFINKTADKFFKTKFDSAGKPLDVDAFTEAKTILYQNPLNGKMYDNKKGREVQYRDQTIVMKVAELAQGVANKNALVKSIFPFVKTGANILQMNLDHNGIYAALSPAQKNVLLSQTPAGALARSQVAFGTFSLAFGTLLAANGAITGSAPVDKKERKALFETGWRPYSVKVGDAYVSYQGYEPVHTMLGFAADTFNLKQAITAPEDEERWAKFSQQVGATLINNFLDKAAFRSGLKQISVLTDPEKVADWQKAMTQTAKGFLPDVSMIQGVFSLGKRAVTQPQSAYEMLFNNYFNRGLGDYRRDVFGDRQDVYGLLVTTAAIQGNEPEYQELSRLAEYGYSPSDIGTTIADTKLKFKGFKDPQTGKSAYDAMQQELGMIVIGGRTLKEAVRELVTSAEYQMLPDGIDSEIRWTSQYDTKVNALNDLFRDYNDAAKENVINDNPHFTNKAGMTIQEAQEMIEIKKTNQLLNQSLDGSADKIRSLF